MVLTKLTKDETKVVLECLKAIISGFFISNDIFTTLLGHTRSDIERLIAIWDNIDQEHENSFSIINNALNNLTYSIAPPQNIWDKYISVSRNEVAKIYYKWLGKKFPKFIWDGKIKGAISRKAKPAWDKFSIEEKNSYLSNTHCPICNQNTSITNYEGGLNVDGNLSILGKCIKCGTPIEVIISTSTIK